MNSTVVDEIRQEVSRQLDPTRRAALGQFMTPATTARFMVSLFSQPVGPIRLLDAGAGIGSLTSSFIDSHPGVRIHVEAWELDPALHGHLARTLAGYAAKGLPVHSILHAEDFIEAATWNVNMNVGSRYSHAILNPPYRKIGSHSKHRLLLREVGIETVNLYAAFVALAILLTDKGGEIVAIIPRSFCNGPYYRPFRQMLLSRCAIRHIHVFAARDQVFADDDVLQENIIIKLEVGGIQREVVISDCHNARFDDYRQKVVPFDRVVRTGDAEAFVHISSLDVEEAASPLFVSTLADVGLEVCTGPVVDFRLREHCSAMPGPGTVPLLYAHHFATGRLEFPIEHRKKPNAIADNHQTRRWLMPRGYYVLTRRFSAKEEKRRLVAFVVNPADLPTDWIGFENHLNVFHIGKRGMDSETAHGLALFLNSTVVDTCFRVFSGHTQVNATDLRQMRYPPRERLCEFGRWAAGRFPSQTEIDDYIRQAEQHG